MTFLRIAVAVVLAGIALPAWAQLDDGRGPDVSIGPDGGSYSVDSGGVQAVDVSLKFTDSDGLNRDTLGVTLSYGGSSQIVTGITYNAPDPMFGTAKFRINLSGAGDHVLSVRIADNTGAIGTRQATYRVTYVDPSLPIVSLAPHHEDFRNTAFGAATLQYALPAYTSLGEGRSAGVRYDSEQANPTGSVQLDVDVHNSQRANYAGGAFSLTIVDAATNQAVTREEWFWMNPGGVQRIGAQWSMRDRPTGAYAFWADVRAYRSDFQTFTLKRVPVRVLVVNHASSRYGSGWSLAGVQRIHSPSPTTDSGFLLEEGNGVARWFAKESCGYAQCTYETPAGDFSTVVYNRAADQWVRTFPDASTATFGSRGLMIAAADRFGRAVTLQWQVSADGQNVPLLARTTDPTGKVTTFTHHSGNYLRSIEDPTGRAAWFYYNHADLSQILGPMNLLAAYNASHELLSFNDPRGQWDVVYDEFGKVRSITAPAVTVNGAAVVRPATQYASLPFVTVPLPGSTGRKAAVPAEEAFTSVSDPGGHKTRVLTDRYGRATKIIDPLGITVFSAKYDDHGLPLSVSDPRQTVVHGWNAKGQLLSKEVNGVAVYHASYVSGDQPTSVTSGGDTRWFRYGDRGELLQSWHGRQTDVDRNATTYTYDGTYRLVSVLGPKGERTEWSYETVWQNVSEVRSLAQDGTWRKSSFGYDAAGRQSSTTNALGETTTTTYDALNRPLRVAASPDRITTLSYTGFELTSVTIPGGKVYGYTYNALGWLERENFPDGRSRSFTYDVDGLTTSRTDRRSRRVDLAYDANHRVITRLADGVQTTFAYPAPYGTLTGVVMKNNEVEETITHHAEVGIPARRTLELGSVSYAVEAFLSASTGWQRMGVDVHRYLNDTLQSTESVRYQPNYYPADTSLSRTFQIHDANGRTTTLGYNASGRHVRTTFPNGVVQENWYDREGQQTATTVPLAPSLGSNYEYDPLGRLNARTSPGGDFRRFYQYDSYGQVYFYQKAELQPAFGCNPSYETCDYFWIPRLEEFYSYDLAGNRTDRGAALEAGSNRYRTFNGFTFEYDAEGNTTRKYKAGFEQRLVWNDLGQLASVTTNGDTVTYGYTPSGERFRRTQAGQNRYYVYDGGNLLLELDAGGNPLRRYTHLPGIDRPLSVRETIAGTDRIYYFALEYPGHVSALMNSTGGIAAGYDYAPFGTETGANDGQPLRFMARELDFSTGLYYVRARWYDASIARFISEDPIGLNGGINTYAYADNDPVNRRDPSGLSPECPNCLPTVTVVCKQGYDPACDERPWWERGALGRWAEDRHVQDKYEPGQMFHQVLEGARSYPRGIGRAVDYVVRLSGAKGQCEMERAGTETVMMGTVVAAAGAAMRTPEGRRLVFGAAKSYVQENTARLVGRFGTGMVVSAVYGPAVGVPAGGAAIFGDAQHGIRQGRTSIEEVIGGALGGSSGPAIASVCH